MTLPNTPTPPNERVIAIDVVRGFTLAGILFANILWISGFLELSEAQRAPMLGGAFDEGALFAVRLLVFGKFYYLFAFLFGVGFSLQLERAEARGRAFTGYFVRRMGVLFAIGCAHALLLWWGDILRFYALLGLALFALRRLRGRRLLLAVGVCLLIPVALQAGQAWLWPDLKLPHLARLKGRAELEFFRNSGFGEWLGFNAKQLVDSGLRQVWDGRVFKILGMFLLGRFAAQAGLFREPARHRRLLTRLFPICLVLGLAGNLGMTALRYLDLSRSARIENAVTEVLYLFAVPALSAGFLFGLLLLLQRPSWARRLAMLAPLGRVSLSAYVSQTLVCVLLFRSYAFELYGRVGVGTLTLIATGVVALQVLIAIVWLRHMRFGPLEWLWRWATYGRRDSLRRSGEPSELGVTGRRKPLGTSS